MKIILFLIFTFLVNLENDSLTLRALQKEAKTAEVVEVIAEWKTYQIGVTSWYGCPQKKSDRFHGRTTANGEIYNTFGFTAAHRKLPFGTLVRVTNLKNQKSVIVRINDRGPYHGNRILDLSYASKQHIGIDGLANVRIEILKNKDEVDITTLLLNESNQSDTI
jgi:rare lipoprotein A